MKVAFITNFHLFRVGFGMGLNRFMRTLRDPEPKEWIPPMTDLSRQKEFKYKTSTVGKAVSDSVEALTGALFLSAIDPKRQQLHGENGLYRAIKWLNDIDCLPLQLAGILPKIRSIQQPTLNLEAIPLSEYKFHQSDRIRDVYGKYFATQMGHF